MALQYKQINPVHEIHIFLFIKKSRKYNTVNYKSSNFASKSILTSRLVFQVDGLAATSCVIADQHNTNRVKITLLSLRLRSNRIFVSFVSCSKIFRWRRD